MVFDNNGLDKLEKYEQETLKVGDEVFMKEPHTLGVITKITDEKVFAITKDGVPYMSHFEKSGTYYKTGLHFDKIGDYLEV